MRALRSIRPGWIALSIVVVAFAAACFMLLAPWQLGKNTATSERNDLIKSAVAIDPVPISELAPPGAPFAPKTEWREVTVTGSFLTDKQALVRLRSVEERPAIEVLTPFRVAGSDRVLVVDRGYVRPDQSSTPVIPPPPAGETTITARIRAAEGTSDGRGARVEGGALTVYTIDPAQLSAATGTAMDPFYLMLSPGQPGALGDIGLPQLDSGPYLSYGLQWLAFGIMAPLGAGYFIFSEIRQRRRAAAAQAAAAQPPAAGPDPDRPDATPTPLGDRPQPAAPLTPPPLSRSERRKQLRAELRSAAGAPAADPAPFDDTAPVGIGAGPDTEHATGTVRDKLTERYGG
ncbi:SURF1 family cytochrome oxidase biogenesis protein [Gordonia sp. VNQ95]|uniref:SURF1 family cytochrome oxidase biogenesis protein n=1 Tax=Gordonia TaxID=2053 RepID=UPI0032B609C2